LETSAVYIGGLQNTPGVFILVMRKTIIILKKTVFKPVSPSTTVDGG